MEISKDIKSKLRSLDQKFIEEYRTKYNSEIENNSKLLESHNQDAFTLRKDILLLTGTIFGSSIALASGRMVNHYFIIGESFLFITIVAGLIILTSHLKSKEWNYAFSSKNSIETYLIMTTNKISNFERTNLESLRDSYKHIMETNQKGLSYRILRLIPIEFFPRIFNYTFVLGIFFTLISIVPPLSWDINLLINMFKN